MKLLQFYLPESGLRVGLLEDKTVFDLSSLDMLIDSALNLFKLANKADCTASQLIANLLKNKHTPEYNFKALNLFPDKNTPHLLIPIYPPEVWAFGVTYMRSASARDEDAGGQQGIYERVYNAARPECFFKATASRCVGSNDYICIRSDSSLTAPEPELAYVLGDNQEILGFTICNDVSAWDIERDNPLYLPQSKIYSGCCAIGPVIVTADELTDPMNLKISCNIIRDNKSVYSDSTHSSRIGRSFNELNKYLYLHNPIPFGTLVSTGTGIMLPNEYHLRAGDIVEIEIEDIGKLINPVKQL